MDKDNPCCQTSSTSSLQPPASSLRAWARLARPFSYTASVIPVLLGAAVAMHWAGPVAWWMFPLALAGAVLFHGSTNIISEYHDLLHGADRLDKLGGSRVLVDGLLAPRQAFVAGLVVLAAAVAVSVPMVLARGWPLAGLAALALVGAYFYSGGPRGYKYVALGDLMVFLLMGPLMTAGTFFVLTGEVTVRVLLLSVPVGLLVASILHANNARDMETDRRAGIKTLALAIGLRGAQGLYVFMVAGAFVGVAVMVAISAASPAKLLPVWALAALAPAPLAWKNTRAILLARPGDKAGIAMLDVQSAKVHLLLGLLLTVAVAFA